MQKYFAYSNDWSNKILEKKGLGEIIFQIYEGGVLLGLQFCVIKIKVLCN